MRKLEKKLEENKIKEEKEAQDLEAMVQHVEQNLQLMTVSVGFRLRSDVRRKFSPVRVRRFCRCQKEVVRMEGGSCSYLLKHSEHRYGVTQTLSLQVLCWNHSFPCGSSYLGYYYFFNYYFILLLILISIISLVNIIIIIIIMYCIAIKYNIIIYSIINL